MKVKKRAFDIFSLSFLDIISCGFGAVVLLVLISKFSVAPETGEAAGDTAAMLADVLAAERQIEALQSALGEARESADSKQALLDKLQAMIPATQSQIAAARAKSAELAADVAGLQVVQNALDRRLRASVQADTAN